MSSPLRFLVSRIFPHQLALVVSFAVISIAAIVLNVPVLRPVLGLTYLLILPGFLILTLLNRTIRSTAHYLYVPGLSIAFITIIALLVNLGGAVIGNGRPLVFAPLMIAVTSAIALLIALNYGRLKSRALQVTRPTALNGLQIPAIAVSVCLPLMAMLGATILNNGGSNIISMICLATCSAVFIFLTVGHKKLGNRVVAIALYGASLSLLLLFSMRSTQLVGWDIFQEYGVFKQTLINARWSPSAVADAYNACTSITVLPVSLKVMSGVSDFLIFKLVFQMCFAFVPVILFAFFMKFASPKKAITAAIFYIAQYQFFIYAGWTRQQIAILFFVLLLLALFDKALVPRVQKSFIVIFAFGMITAHYSTTYLSIALLCVFYIASQLVRLFKNYRLQRPQISGVLLSIIVLMAFFWGYQATASYGNLSGTLTKSLSNIGSLLSEDVRMGQSSPLQQFNLNYSESISTEDLEGYLRSTQDEYRAKFGTDNSNIKSNAPVLVQSSSMDAHVPGVIIQKVTFFGELTKKAGKLLVILGVVILVYGAVRYQRYRSFAILSASALFVLVLITSLPYISLDYNVLRAYQHMLCVLALPAALGLYALTKFLGHKIQPIVIGLFLLFQLLFLSGWIFQLTGGAPGTIQFNNSGTLYEEAYAHPSEAAGAAWLYANYDKELPVYADHNASYRLWAFGGYFGAIREDVVPQVIDKDAYVFSDYTNTTLSRGVLPSAKYLKGKAAYYVFPTDYLQTSKNSIYSSGTTRIYR